MTATIASRSSGRDPTPGPGTRFSRRRTAARARRAPKKLQKLRVLVLMDADLVPPPEAHSLPGADIQAAPWKMEYDVAATLENVGHEVRPLGVHDDLNVIRDAVMTFQPSIAFNLLEGFRDF